jgi:hypothetical protein
MTDLNTASKRNVKLLRSGDPKSRFHYASASDVLRRYRLPNDYLALQQSSTNANPSVS